MATKQPSSNPLGAPQSAEAKVELSTPWGDGHIVGGLNSFSNSASFGSAEGIELSRSGGLFGPSPDDVRRAHETRLAQLQAQSNFVNERTRLHELYIKEHARNRRLALVLSFLLILVAVAAVLFAPAGREVMSYWIGAALLITAAGASGYGKIWAKAPGFFLVLTDQPGKDSWPISGASFVLMQKSQDNADKAAAVLKFFDYSFKNGGKAAIDMDYVPMPANVVKLVQDMWKTDIKTASGQEVWK